MRSILFYGIYWKCVTISIDSGIDNIESQRSPRSPAFENLAQYCIFDSTDY